MTQNRAIGGLTGGRTVSMRRGTNLPAVGGFNQAVIRSIEAPQGVTTNRFGTLRGVRAVGFDLPAASDNWREALRSSLTGSGHVRSQRANR